MLIIALLYRRVTTLGKLSVVFLVGVLAVLGWVLFEGAIRFDPALAFDTTLTDEERPNDFGLALGAGMGFAIYSYLGYYNVCYLGGEVRDPARTIPRSILAQRAGRRRAVHARPSGHHRRRAVARGGEGEGQPDGRRSWAASAASGRRRS